MRRGAMGKSVSADTKILGVFGYPIRHSASPAMHNAAIKALGLDYVYVAFEVKPECLGDAIRGLPSLGISGVNLTIPHKEKAIQFVDELSAEAAMVGAMNTIVVDSGKMKGYNTDIGGFLKSLSEEAGYSPEGKKAVLLGAGGGARGVSFGLAQSGLSELIVVNKPFEMAENLVSELTKRFSKLKLKALEFDSPGVTDEISHSSLLINATPLGMKGENPLRDTGCIHKNLTVYDLVYIPLSTPLLEAARKGGARIVGGLDMLVYQGAASFELWTGKKAPIDVMKHAAAEDVKKKCKN